MTVREIVLVYIIIILLMVVSILYFKPPKEKIIYKEVMVEGIPSYLEGFSREMWRVGQNDERTKIKLVIRRGQLVQEDIAEDKQ